LVEQAPELTAHGFLDARRLLKPRAAQDLLQRMTRSPWNFVAAS
jgi:hypothetical protein